MEENKVATDMREWELQQELADKLLDHGKTTISELLASAPNSPELTRLSGEQAETRAAKEIREELGKYLAMNEGETIIGGIRNLAQAYISERDNCTTLESECSRLASHVQELKSDVRRWKDASDANRDEAMKQQDLKLGQKQIASRLASRVEELEKALEDALTRAREK